MVARIHDTFYDAKATLLSEADIKEIRESRGRIPSASKKMAEKFHIGPKRVYEIWNNINLKYISLHRLILLIQLHPLQERIYYKQK